METKPKVLLLGGCGYIGRNLVKYLLQNELVSFIRVADKILPVMAYLHPEMEAIFESPLIQFVQCDLTGERHVNRAFDTLHEDQKCEFDVVINAAGETRVCQDPSTYRSRCRDLPVLCAQIAARNKVPRFIEISTAYVYKSHTRTAPTESEKPIPHGKVAMAKREAEIALLNMTDIEVIIVRPALVYGGSGDINGGVLLGRAVCAACYTDGSGKIDCTEERLPNEMTVMWDEHMKINTVHVFDLCRALWLLYWEAGAKSIWNICDKSDTDQGKFGTILESIFGIKVAYLGSFRSNIARLMARDLMDMANERHLQPWDDTCKRYGVTNTPLSPLVSEELLDHYNCFLNGCQIEDSLRFVYEYPVISADLVLQSIRQGIEGGIFPNIIVRGEPLMPTGGAEHRK